MKGSVLTLLLLAALVLGLSFAIQAEDDPETAYDESESLPCEVTRPLVTVELHPSAAAQSALARTQRLVPLCDETGTEQPQSARPRLSKSIVVLSCVRRC